MNRNELEILVHKQLTGCISEEEKQQLDLLSTSHSESIEEVTSLWDAAEDFVPNVSFDANLGFANLMTRIEEDSTSDVSGSAPDEGVGIPQKAKVVSMFSVRKLSRVAAMLVMGMLSYMTYQQLSYQTITAGDSARYATLQDGTSVWLAPHSSIETKKSFASDRSVVLEGKAFFDVYRDENHPFTIDADDITVSVLGTSFTVDSQNAVVAVSSGKVKVETPAGETLLTRDQKVSIIDGANTVADIPTGEFDWVVPILSFDNTPLDQVIKELALHFDADLAYKGRVDLSNCPFTATNLEGATLEQVVSILQATYDMEVNTDQETGSITFSKVRCK